MNFKDKVVIITGAGTGIGRATAIAFAQRDAHVVIAGRDSLKGEETVSIIKANEKESCFVKLNLTDTDSVKDMVNKVKNKYGTIDILINNAGIYCKGDAVETSEEEWDRVMSVNLKGMYLCCHYVLPIMRKQEHGVIVNVSSEAGLVGIKGQVAYNVSKAGVISLTKSMAVDFASRGIRINAVCPGTTETPLVLKVLEKAENPDELRNSLESCRPLNRLGKPEEIAMAILAMSSEELAYATGSIMVIDGGYTAK